MWLFIKEFAVIGISILAGILVSLGFVPGRVVAPDVTVPAPVVQVEEEGVVTENEEPAEEPIEEKEVAPPPVATAPAPRIDDYEKSLQEALDALAQLQEAQKQSAAATSGINETVRSAVVNILCTTAGAGQLNPISASGVVIDSRGVVLTNAHVGQYFLLKDWPKKDFITCTIRTGSPAYPAYKASLLFLPPSWIAANAQKIVQSEPTGNGEHDYALLLITGTVSGDPLPALPYLPLITGGPELGSSVLLAAYPAGFLGGTTITKQLYAASANASVEKVYTFDTDTLDLFSIGGSVVAQQGSSGGAAAQASAESASGAALLGLIVTSSIAEDTASRELRALSTQYIMRDFSAESGMSFVDYLSGNLESERELFMKNIAPTLSAALIKVLGE